MSDFSDVGDFHRKFDLPAVETGPMGRFCVDAGPKNPDIEMINFRLQFMLEELQEFVQGMEQNDPEQMFDALLDLVYVALGTAHIFGFPWPEGWNEVHNANMAKIRALPDGSNSTRGSGFDVVKPEGWVAPNIQAILDHFNVG